MIGNNYSFTLLASRFDLNSFDLMIFYQRPLVSKRQVFNKFNMNNYDVFQLIDQPKRYPTISCQKIICEISCHHVHVVLGFVAFVGIAKFWGCVTFARIRCCWICYQNSVRVDVVKKNIFENVSSKFHVSKCLEKLCDLWSGSSFKIYFKLQSKGFSKLILSYYWFK